MKNLFFFVGVTEHRPLTPLAPRPLRLGVTGSETELLKNRALRTTGWFCTRNVIRSLLRIQIEFRVMSLARHGSRIYL